MPRVSAVRWFDASPALSELVKSISAAAEAAKSNNVAVMFEPVVAQAQRIKELASCGGSMPKSARDILRVEEEQGLAGVFTFDSPGAHTPVGLTELEMTRLGRSLAVSMCYFLIKRCIG